jgi:hypothetical protein
MKNLLYHLKAVKKGTQKASVGAGAGSRAGAGAGAGARAETFWKSEPEPELELKQIVSALQHCKAALNWSTRRATGSLPKKSTAVEKRRSLL